VTGAPGSARIEEVVRDRDRFDPFRWIRDATDAHRGEHHCWAYPYEDGTVLGAIIAELRPERVLELGAALGAALGYTACWWATGGALVDSRERPGPRPAGA
jgi:predicted O-methyltransferase YrrM